MINEEQEFFITTDIFDVEGCLAAKIVNNEFILNRNCEFTWNQDESGFEVVDNDFDVVFSVDVGKFNNTAPLVTIQGVFYQEDHFKILADKPWKIPKGMPKKLKEVQKNIKPLFEYFGKDWFGKRR